MGSQLISNAVRSFFLAMILTGLLTGSVSQSASYKTRDGTTVNPILDNFSNAHDYSGPNLRPNANLTGADLTGADLHNADLHNANLFRANLTGVDLAFATLSEADLSDANLTYADLANANLFNVNLFNVNLTNANLAYATLYHAILADATLTKALLPYADLTNANLTEANLYRATLFGADLSYANLSLARMTYANLTYADLYSANLTDAFYVETSTGSPYYYLNTMLSSGFDPVAQGWRLAPYCDFTPDAACDLADINQMFQAGNLVTGVATSGDTDRLDLVDNDTIDAADITEWLSQAATANSHGSPHLRGDTELDRDVDITDFNALASHFDPSGVEDSPYGPWNAPLWNEGNFDGDGDTDITDFNLLAANFAPDGYNSSAIPEPTTMLLASLALILLGVSFRLSKND